MREVKFEKRLEDDFCGAGSVDCFHLHGWSSMKRKAELTTLTTTAAAATGKQKQVHTFYI